MSADIRARFTGPSTAIEVGILQLELVQQEGARCGGQLAATSRRTASAELALRQLALERLAQVLDFFLVDPQVGVAGDAELRIVDHLAAGEQLVQMGVHDRRQQHEAHCPRPAISGGIAITRGTRRGALTMATLVSRPKASLPGELDDEVQALVDDLRKRVRRVEADRRQQRPDLALEVVGDPGALRRVAVGVAQHADTGRGERRQDLPVQHARTFRPPAPARPG